VTFLSIYTVIFGPFWTVQEIHEGVVKVNFTVGKAVLPYLKKGVERAEVDADVPNFQTKQKLKKIEDAFNPAIEFDQNIVQT
jgi:hypothetical protein